MDSLPKTTYEYCTTRTMLFFSLHMEVAYGAPCNYATRGRRKGVATNAQPCATTAYSRVDSRFEMNLEREKGREKGGDEEESRADY